MENTTGAEKLDPTEAKPKTFYEACVEGDLTLVDKYLKAGEDVNQVFIVKGKEWTPLMRASFDGHVRLLKVLLKNAANVNLQDRDGWTALMCASQHGHSEVVKLLHEYGAQVHLQNNNGWTALMAASQNGHSTVSCMYVWVRFT